MIKTIIDFLNQNELYGISKNIDIAKGIHKLPYNWREGKLSMKRIWKSK
jgi:hypothetical protein